MEAKGKLQPLPITTAKSKKQLEANGNFKKALPITTKKQVSDKKQVIGSKW